MIRFARLISPPAFNMLSFYILDMRLWEQKILDAVAKIPRGRVSTYGLVAKASGVKCARLVGKALHHNPDPLRYPCHRVVFLDGSLSKNFTFGGKTGQKNRLAEEGVSFLGDRVDMSINMDSYTGNPGILTKRPYSRYNMCNYAYTSAK